MSLTFTLSGTESILSSSYYPPIILDDSEYVLGLINLETFNSIANIDNTNNKFYFTLQNGKQSIIKISEGAYEIDDLNKYLIRELGYYDKGINSPIHLKLDGNNNTLRCQVKANFDIDFTKSDSVGTLLGFKSRKLKAGKTHVSDFPSKISKVNALCIECNIVSGAYRNGEQVHVVHEFFPSVPPGYKIIEAPANVIYLPINTKQIDEVTIKVTDQDGNIVNFRGEVITVRLHLRKIR